MATWRVWPSLAKWGLALTVGAQAGCLSVCHPIKPPPREELACCANLSQCQKHKVYIFFVHGCDPLDLSNFEGLHDYVNSLGFIKTYFGGTYHGFYYEKEIRKLRKEQPNARIVLIGFDKGAAMARDVACSVHDEGIQIDLLVYLDGQDTGDRPLHHPGNAARVLCLLSRNAPEGSGVERAENDRYDDVSHHGIVSDKRTLLHLARELCDVARQVPIIRRDPLPVVPVVPVGPQLPAPNEPAADLPAPKEISKEERQWGFLRPDGFAHGAPGPRPLGQAAATPPATMLKR